MQKRKIISMMLSLLFLVFIAGCAQEDIVSDVLPDQDVISTPPDIIGESDQGRMIVTITDAAADMGSISQVRMTTNNVMAHHTADGWITLSNEQQTYDLLELNEQDKIELMSDANVSAGTYNQVVFDIEEVIVVDDEGSHEATVPSGKYRVNIDVEVEENETSTIEFDIIAEESLHITGEGTYIMAPVAEVRTRSNAEVSAMSANRIQISGGQVMTDKKVGMDANGNIGVGLNIPADARIRIGGQSNVNISSGSGSNDSMSGNAQSNPSVDISI